MSEPFHGVLPALVMPFTDDGAELDTEALAAIVDRLVAAGVGGLVLGGSTGEFATLTHTERRLLVETTVEAAAARVPVVAGTGALVDARGPRPASSGPACGRCASSSKARATRPPSRPRARSWAIAPVRSARRSCRSTTRRPASCQPCWTTRAIACSRTARPGSPTGPRPSADRRRCRG